MRRVISFFAIVSLFATGLTVGEAAPAQAVESFGTITGTVTFGTAPSWDTAGKDFVVSLIN